MDDKKKGTIEKVVLIAAALVAVIAALLLFLFYSKAGKRLTAKVIAGYIHGSVNYVPGDKGDTESPEGTDKTDKTEYTNKAENTENKPSVFEKPEEIVDEKPEDREYYHILLLGEEALKGSPGQGRTDAMILATIHVKQRKVILTSVLRDSYVEPEGMQPCKINAVYARQGVSGIYQILYEKLGVWPDGYMKVGFDSFESIIDLLGGAEVTLTEEEAEYLRTHNYISKPEFRNVTAGKQILNGNQTLGYCRVRFVPNCNGMKYDYGRTERQRMVLNNLFERYIEAGITKWAKILKQALGYVETDIDKQLMEELIYVIYDGNITTLEQRQLPAKGTFKSDDVGNVTSTLVLDWEKNKDIFWDLLK